MARMYNAPNANPSSIGETQFNTFKWQRKALIELKKDQFFMPMADVESMPKHYGKTIKRYLYLPLLDDANINDQGLNMQGHSGDVDANPPVAGAIPQPGDIRYTATIILKPKEMMLPGVPVGSPATDKSGYQLSWIYAVGYGTTPAAATAVAETIASGYIAKALNATTAYADYSAAKPAWEGAAATPTGNVIDETYAGVAGAVPYGGNLYASSKDVGTIVGKLPALSEQGGRVNKVGFRRTDLEGSISKFGIFDEWTKDSLDFDTDEEMGMHANREMLRGANEITEDQVQIDLLMSAGIVRYTGSATSTNTVVGMVTYNDIVEIGVALDNNRTPKHIKIITGSRMVDTKVIPAARPMFIGSEMIPYLKSMKDYFGNPAFISVEKYAAAGNTMNGEIGAIDQFRLIVAPEMMHWADSGGSAYPPAGAGTPAISGVTNYELRSTNGIKADIFPMLVVGDASFTCIGFQTDGKVMKFKIITKQPGKETADWHDPFGEKGFMSIKWWYGFMVLRPERIALIKTALPRNIIMGQPKKFFPVP